jgi:putative ABC transport system permease protein
MAFTAIVRYPLRSAMLLVAISIGVTAVLLLTSLGEGARLYVTNQFNSMGTHLLVVTPGKNEVGGIGSMAGALSGTTRPLTLQDGMAVERSPWIATVTAFMPGGANINYDGIERGIDILGTTHHMKNLFDYQVARGRFLPDVDLDNANPICVIGDTIANEIFRGVNPVGKWVRLGERRVRVIGVMEQAGQSGPADVDESVFVPVGFAIQMFNRESLHRMLIEATDANALGPAESDIVQIIKARHGGNEDVTVQNQGAILKTFNTIFLVLTSTLAGIAAISLAVAGTLIMNVMLVAVSQRTEEIGLIKAVGGTRRQIIGMFLTEAAMLSLLGAFLGLFVGQSAIGVLREVYPIVDFRAPDWAVMAAIVMAVGSGLIFGILPARRAADLDPVEALLGH